MPKKRFTDEEEMAIVDYYADGETAQELADYYSVSMQLIVNTLARRGIERRSRGPRHHSKIHNLEFQAKVKRLFENWSQQKIADHLRCSQSVVARALHAQGIKAEHRSGERHGMWKGGRVFLNGYAYVHLAADHEFAEMRNSGGYCAEHRLKMAKKLERALRKTETVHHKNGNKQDNRLRNLQLRQGNHGRGAAFKCRSCGSSDIVPVRLD